MKAFILGTCLMVALLGSSCKKSNSGDDAEDTQVTTLALEYTAPDYGINGLKFTFRIHFDEVGSIKEFGILYIPWIGQKTQKTPLWDDDDTLKYPFEGTAIEGTILTKVINLHFADFNDVNYRAYAVTSNGTVVYGRILYFVSA